MSDPTVEEVLHGVPLFREFAGLDNWNARLPDESTILWFLHLLERQKLAPQISGVVNDLLRGKGLLLKADTVVNVTVMSAPGSTKTASGERDPETVSSAGAQLRTSKMGNPWPFGTKAHIGVDAESGLVHTVRSTAGRAHDAVEANSLLHGEETDAFDDSGYRGAGSRLYAKSEVIWHIAMRPRRRKALVLSSPLAVMIDKSQQILVGVRAKVEHPFRVIKRQFRLTKVRYRGLKKRAAQVQPLFALSNLWMVRRILMSGPA